jgi:trans-2,3-dihydro-3-hydroxyanthranilate isomerase
MISEKPTTARRFHVLDVFTERALAGNPLAVVLDCDGLDGAAMLAITREFNLSETVFVFNPVDPVNSARIRIFTPGGELPFAGHPSVGTAALLAHLHAGEHLRNGVVVALELEIGLLHADVSRRPSGALRAVFDLPRLPEALPVPLDAEAVAAALDIDPLDLGFGAHGLSVWSAGVPFAMVPVKDRETLARVQVVDMNRWRAAFGVTGKGAAYVYTRETENPAHHVRARMFHPLGGIAEDPATGSAAAAFAGVAASVERPEDGVHQLVIEQGFEMGRPSLIALDLEIRGGLLARAALGGSVVRVSEGKLHV